MIGIDRLVRAHNTIGHVGRGTSAHKQHLIPDNAVMYMYPVCARNSPLPPPRRPPPPLIVRSLRARCRQAAEQVTEDRLQPAEQARQQDGAGAEARRPRGARLPQQRPHLLHVRFLRLSHRRRRSRAHRSAHLQASKSVNASCLLGCFAINIDVECVM